MSDVPVGPSESSVAEGSHPIAGPAACPLCHTLAPSARSGNEDWTCATCGQHWSARGLETAAAYAIHEKAYPRRARAFEVVRTTSRQR